MQVNSPESHLGHWNKVTDYGLYSIFRGATWLTAFVSVKKEEQAVVSLEAYSSIALEGDLEQDSNLNDLNCRLKVTHSLIPDGDWPLT